MNGAADFLATLILIALGGAELLPVAVAAGFLIWAFTTVKGFLVLTAVVVVPIAMHYVGEHNRRQRYRRFMAEYKDDIDSRPWWVLDER
jgi:hypothetical protein